MADSRAGIRQEGVTTVSAFGTRCVVETGSIAPSKHEAASKIGGLCLRSIRSQLFYVCRSCLLSEAGLKVAVLLLMALVLDLEPTPPST